jgi:predicted nucleic acid-binding protein
LHHLRNRAWRVAHDFGWAKAYDAEHVALAEILDCRLVAIDGNLHRDADRLSRVVTSEEPWSVTSRIRTTG